MNAMTPSTPTRQGLPSPAPRTPITPSSRFPFVLAPKLPKVGTAKIRLRSNAFGLLAYLVVWWQGDIYAYLKQTITWFVHQPGIPKRGIEKTFSWIENVTLFVLLWNIAEAVWVIRSAPPPAPLPASASTSPFRQSQRLARIRGSNLKLLSDSVQSAPTSPLQASVISPYLDQSLASSTATNPHLFTPVRRPQFDNSTSSPFSHEPSFSASRLGASQFQRSVLSHSYSTSAELNTSQSSLGQSIGADSPLASYYGRHPESSGRALDGSVLRQLLSDPSSSSS